MNRKPNSRRANGSRRTALRNWLRSLGRPCWICVEFGLPGDIDYDLPAGHPMSFEVDELVPVSLGGDPLDPANVDAAHRRCNQWRGNRTVGQVRAIAAARGKCGAAPGASASSGRPPLPVSRDWRAFGRR